MNRDIFMYLTGLKLNQMEKLDVESVNAAITTFYGALEEYKPKGREKFELDDKKYLFSKRISKKKHIW